MTIKSYKYKFAKKLANEEEYQLLADSLIEFAQKESSLDINEFPLSLMIKPDDFAGFSSHSEYFANSYDTALRLIGARIKQLMYQGTIDRHFALEMLPLYDPEYRQYLKISKLKDETVGETKFTVVRMPEWHSIPDSIWQKFALGRNETEDQRNERFRIINELLSHHLTQEEMAEMTQLAAKVTARRERECGPEPAYTIPKLTEGEFQESLRNIKGPYSIKRIDM